MNPVRSRNRGAKITVSTGGPSASAGIRSGSASVVPAGALGTALGRVR
jgi:hypothetical protein